MKGHFLKLLSPPLICQGHGYQRDNRDYDHAMGILRLPCAVPSLLIQPSGSDLWHHACRLLPHPKDGPQCGGVVSKHGQYTYANGFNPAAIITTVVAFVVGYFVPDYAFFVTFAIGVVGYVVLMRVMVMPNTTSIWVKRCYCLLESDEAAPVLPCRLCRPAA